MKTSIFAMFIMSLVAANGTQSSSPINTPPAARTDKQADRAAEARREIDKRLSILESRS